MVNYPQFLRLAVAAPLAALPAALLAALLAAGCNQEAPTAASPSAKASASGAPAPSMRYAEPTLPPPAFADPGRRAKLEAAFPEVERYLTEEALKMNLPGLAFGVVIDGDLAYSKGFGVRDVSSKAPVDADSLFRIASMTKSFTAMAILKLRDEGKLALDDPAAKHVPELSSLPYPTRDSAPITIRNLLSMAPGFPEDNPWADRQLAISEDDFTRMLAQGFPFSNTPGVAFEYSNLAFAILGRIVRNVAGTGYTEYLSANLLGPIGMSASVLDEKKAPPDRVAKGYRREDEALVAETNLGDGAFGAIGGLYSSVRDMARYAAFQLAAWPPRDDADTGPLRRSSLREMQQAARFGALGVTQGTEKRPRDAWADGYAFGFGAAQTCDFEHIVSHGGGLPGYGSHIFMLPEHGVALVALANLTYAPAGRLTRGVARILRSTGALQRRAIAPAAALVKAQEAVNRLLSKWDDKDADAAFADSYFLDVPRAKLKAELHALGAAHGACRPDGAIDPENALRGAWKLSCEKGWITLGLTLAPTTPPRIQALTMKGALPLDPELSDAAAKLTGLLTKWDDAAAKSLFDPEKLDAEKMKKLFLETAAARGACSIDKPLGSDGKAKARLLLWCERYPIVLDFKRGEQSGAIESVQFDPVDFRTGRCLQ
jgi:CubicO group peptidase (beta-lactamase class C family)